MTAKELIRISLKDQPVMSPPERPKEFRKEKFQPEKWFLRLFMIVSPTDMTIVWKLR